MLMSSVFLPGERKRVVSQCYGECFYNMLSQIMAEGFTVTMLQHNSNSKYRFSVNITKKNNNSESVAASFDNNSLRKAVAVALAWGSVFPQTEKQLDDSEDKEGMVYSKIFQKEIGARMRARYDAGDPPRLHRLVFDAIVRELDGQNRGIVLLSRIEKELQTTRVAVLRILSCFEVYGYMRIIRIRNRIEGGTNLEFEILRRINCG